MKFPSPLMIERITRIHDALRQAGIPHAFGGAIANAFCGLPRATTDIDINIFLPETNPDGTLQALEGVGVRVNWSRDPALIRRDGQIRLRWDQVLVDLFFATFDFLEAAGNRVRIVPFMGGTIPVLSAEDLIICKVGFNRDRDWLDLREIVRIQASRLDRAYLDRWLAMMDNERIARFRKLLADYG